MLHKIFYEELLQKGFRRTIWQIVFPGQIAGIVRGAESHEGGINECHVRFYEDGTIHSELEVSRFDGGHWSGPREDGSDYLEGVIRQEIFLNGEMQKKIIDLIGKKDFSTEVTRVRRAS